MRRTKLKVVIRNYNTVKKRYDLCKQEIIDLEWDEIKQIIIGLDAENDDVIPIIIETRDFYIKKKNLEMIEVKFKHVFSTWKLHKISDFFGNYSGNHSIRRFKTIVNIIYGSLISSLLLFYYLFDLFLISVIFVVGTKLMNNIAIYLIIITIFSIIFSIASIINLTSQKDLEYSTPLSKEFPTFDYSSTLTSLILFIIPTVVVMVMKNYSLQNESFFTIYYGFITFSIILSIIYFLVVIVKYYGRTERKDDLLVKISERIQSSESFEEKNFFFQLLNKLSRKPVVKFKSFYGLFSFLILISPMITFLLNLL